MAKEWLISVGVVGDIMYNKFVNFWRVRKSREIFLNFLSCFPSPNMGSTSISHILYCKYIATVSNFVNMILVKKLFLSKQILAQSQPRKHLKTCEICWKSTIKTPKRIHWCNSGVIVFNFEHILHHFPELLLLILNCYLLAGP